MELFGRYMFNDDSDINGTAEEVVVARTYVPVTHGIHTRRNCVMLNAPARLPRTLWFLRPVVHFLPTRFKYPSLFEIGRHLTVLKRSEE